MNDDERKFNSLIQYIAEVHGLEYDEKDEMYYDGIMYCAEYHRRGRTMAVVVENMTTGIGLASACVYDESDPFKNRYYDWEGEESMPFEEMSKIIKIWKSND